MTADRNEPIRLRVWLVILAPIAVVALAGAYALVPDEKPPAKHASTSTEETSPPPAIPPPSTPPQPPPVAPPSAPAAVAVVSAPAPATSAEAFREIDALLARPPNSAQWTVEEKNAYRAKLVDDLLVRERSLDREVATAHRSRDTAAEQTKTATLDYLRRRREALEAQIHGTPDAGSLPDAGS